MGIWLNAGMYELRNPGKSHKTGICHKTSSRPYGQELLVKERNHLISYGRKPQSFMFSYFKITGFSINYNFAYFSRSLNLPVSPVPCRPFLNLTYQLLFRSPDVHPVIFRHQIGLHLLASNFVLLQINKIDHLVWKLLDNLDTTVYKGSPT